MIRTTGAALLAALLATGAAAQEQPQPAAPAETTTPAETTPAPAEGAEPADPAETLGLSMGEAEGEELGAPYTRETSGEWEVRCIRTGTEHDPCQLYQLLQDSTGNNVAEISVFPLPAGGEAVAGATIITPLETLLTAQVSLRVDSGAVKRYPFTFCSQMGCFSRIGLTEDDVAGFRRGNTLTMTIRPFAAPDQTVDLVVSLSGFTAGFQTVADANAAALAAQQEQGQQPAPAPQQ